MTDEDAADGNRNEKGPSAQTTPDNRNAQSVAQIGDESHASDAHGAAAADEDDTASDATELPEEFGGYDGPEPTRYGDWQHRGRVSDF